MRHSRNIPALSAAECAALRGKTVAVIGCGGLGGYLIEYFARIGIGALRCVDGDCFEESNLNRQLLSEVSNLGMNKAEAALRRIRAIDPEVRAEAYPIFLDAENAAQLISGCDAVVDALDGIEARRILARACKAASIPYVYGAISGWVAQAAVCMPEDELIDKLYPEEVHLCDKSALSFTPALCAAMQAALCVRLLAGRGVQSGKLYYADLLYGEYEQILLK